MREDNFDKIAFCLNSSLIYDNKFKRGINLVVMRKVLTIKMILIIKCFDNLVQLSEHTRQYSTRQQLIK